MASSLLLLWVSGTAGAVQPGGALRVRGYRTTGPVGEEAAGAEAERTAYGFSRARMDAWLDTTARDSLYMRLALRMEYRGDRDDPYTLDLAEAYALWEHVAWTPLSIHAGRQGALAESGLVAGGPEGDWALDGIRLHTDFLPWEINLRYGRIADVGAGTPVREMGWAGIRRKGAGHSFGGVYAAFFPLKERGERPILAGGEVQWHSLPQWLLRGEACLQRGRGPGAISLQGYLADASLTYRLPAPWEPSLSARWTHASGESNPSSGKAFVPLLHGAQWGGVFHPRLSNLHVLTLQGACRPVDDLRLRAAWYALRQDRSRAGPASGNRLDHGGYQADAGGNHRQLGHELELLLAWTPDQNLALELRGGYFFAGKAFDGQPGAGDASALRATLRLRF